MELINKSYSFYCDCLNEGKVKLLYDKALVLRDFKNEISKKVCENFVFYANKSKFDWTPLFRTKLEYCNNQDISNAIEHVYTSYQNKQNAFVKNIKTQVQKGVETTYYKKSTAGHKKGGLKACEITFKTTKLSAVVTYLARYYNAGLVDYIRGNKSDKEVIQKLRDEVTRCVDKFGDRLINLAIQKQERSVRKLSEHPIEFKSLSFTSCTEQKQNILSKNPRTTSKYNAFITLSGQKTDDGKIHIPVKLSKKHHGSIREYCKEPNKKGQINVSYTVLFEKNNLRVVLTRKMLDETVTGKNRYYGTDANIKHNLFCDKYGNEIDFDRKMFNGYVKFLKKCDKKLSKKPEDDKKLSNRDLRQKDNWIVRIKDMLKRKSSLLVKRAIKMDGDHIVMEDLLQMGKTFFRSEELEGFKYSRLIHLLNLTDLKNIVSSIANKHNIQTTFIQPHYTSKGCDKCGLIDDNNRKTQELFKCIRCGHEMPADAHAASMIEDRLSLDVLRKSLLNLENGLYTPKKLNKNSIKNILTECYDTDAHKSAIADN